jgi:hypothetical protein
VEKTGDKVSTTVLSRVALIVDTTTGSSPRDPERSFVDVRDAAAVVHGAAWVTSPGGPLYSWLSDRTWGASPLLEFRPGTGVNTGLPFILFYLPLVRVYVSDKTFVSLNELRTCPMHRTARHTLLHLCNVEPTRDFQRHTSRIP